VKNISATNRRGFVFCGKHERLIELLPDQLTLKVQVAVISFCETGDDTAVRSGIAALPPSIANDSDVLAWQLLFALIDRNWAPVSAQLLSSLAVVDTLLGHGEEAISEARRAVEMCPISKEATVGPGLVINLAVVYAWTNELDLAFETLGPLTKTPWGIYYGDLKRDPYWEPLRKDARYEKMLAELAPREQQAPRDRFVAGAVVA
jgi:hypothetical protein